MIKVALCGFTSLFLLSAAIAHAEIVRCDVVDRTHDLMPEWIEYEINARGTVLEVRDSVGVRLGVDWVRGEIVENTPRRMTLTWDVGMILIGHDFPGAHTKVVMRLTRLPNGTIQVIGLPTRVAYGNIERYNGRATCTG